MIELHRCGGRIAGRLLAAGEREPLSFDGWLELLALLEATCALDREQEIN